MPTVPALPALDPFTDAYEADPHAAHRALLEQSPVVTHPFGLAVLGYHEVQAAFRNRRLVNPPHLLLPMFGVTEGPVYERVGRGLLTTDGEEHARLRRLVARAFTPHTAAALRERMESSMRELLDGAEDELDVVDLVRTYPIAVICQLLGIPRADWDRISGWTDDLFRLFRPTVAAELDVIETAWCELDDYVDGLVAERRAGGLVGTDLITELLRVGTDDDRLAADEIRMLVSTVLTAGTDTTRNQLAAAVHAFALHPDQWERLRTGQATLSGAVDEVLRWCPIALGVPRIAATDTAVGDVEIAAGGLVLLLMAAGNRDPSVFDDPDRFDVSRSWPEPPLTFGGGIHACLGMHLARAELVEGLRQIAERWPRIELAGPVPWKPRQGASGPVSLPVRIRH